MNYERKILETSFENNAVISLSIKQTESRILAYSHYFFCKFAAAATWNFNTCSLIRSTFTNTRFLICTASKLHVKN